MLKMLRVYMRKNQFELGSTKLEIVSSTIPIGDRGEFDREDAESKQGNYLTGYSLSGCFIWERLVGCV